jgi:hypothetical protein
MDERPKKRTGPLLWLSAKPGCFWLTIAVSLPIAAVSAWSWAWRKAMHDAFVGETGPVPLRADWPRPLKELLDDPGGIEIDESNIQVHCLCRGWDDTFVWRMDAEPGLFELIAERWNLIQTTDSRDYVLEGHRETKSGVHTPAWWKPIDDDGTQFFVSEGESYHFHVALDKGRNTIWVHWWFDF